MSEIKKQGRFISLRNIKVLWFKETKSYFLSPLAYVLTAIFIFLLGWSFYNLIELVNARPEDPMNDLLRGLFANMNTFFVFMAPLVTMRLFAEEKRDQTLDLLFNSRLSDGQIILGKFLAALTVFFFMMLISLLFPVMVSLSGLELGGNVWTGYLGTIFNVMSYLSLGLFASSLTKNQIVAALLGFLFFFVFYLFGWSAYTSSNFMVGQILHYLSLHTHFEPFLMGAVRSYDLVFYLSFIIFMFYLTLKSLSSRHW